jgi:ATP-binding cassette, subfamily A (ABC1), member 3
MLTGAIAPTSGTAHIAGKDIRTQIPEIRRDIGICMQHDCLFPRLTVREHVEFFTRLKGFYDVLSKEEADKHVDQAIEDVALWEKRNTYTSNLSGGMKRKLSVAIAFCGGSKVVVLDEPTSGMDPFSRRFTWNVIRHYRQNRVIILTTHYMDEADILGDRIAIMSDGKLRCVGSSLFLKKIFGSGYQLTIEKNQVLGHPPHGGVTPPIRLVDNGDNPIHIDESDEGSIEVSEENPYEDMTTRHVTAASSYRRDTTYVSSRELKAIVTSYVSEAKLLSDVGSELSYQLPIGSSSQFTSMFQQLDDQIEKGSVSCYGVSITTLDEVFMLVTRGAKLDKATFASSRHGSGDLLSNNESSELDQSTVVSLDEEISFARHLRTLLKKRAAIFRRDKKAWLFTTILPSLFVLFGFCLFNVIKWNQFWPPITLRVEDLNNDDPVPYPVRNPIAVNSPGNPFMCQTPTCSHKRPFIQEELTNETYFFCGFQSKLGISYEGYTPTNSTCNITDSMNIIGTLSNNNGTVATETVVSNITDVSINLSNGKLLHLTCTFN